MRIIFGSVVKIWHKLDLIYSAKSRQLITLQWWMRIPALGYRRFNPHDYQCRLSPTNKDGSPGPNRGAFEMTKFGANWNERVITTMNVQFTHGNEAEDTHQWPNVEWMGQSSNCLGIEHRTLGERYSNSTMNGERDSDWWRHMDEGRNTQNDRTRIKDAN